MSDQPETFTEPDDIVRVLKAAARANRAKWTPEDYARNEMHDHWAKMLDDTMLKIRAAIEADGWHIWGLETQTDGHVAIRLWRKDMLDAAKRAAGRPV